MDTGTQSILTSVWDRLAQRNDLEYPFEITPELGNAVVSISPQNNENQQGLTVMYPGAIENFTDDDAIPTGKTFYFSRSRLGNAWGPWQSTSPSDEEDRFQHLPAHKKSA